MCAFFPAVQASLFWFVLLGLLKTLIYMDSWTFKHKTQHPYGLASVPNSTHHVIMSDTIHFFHFIRT